MSAASLDEVRRKMRLPIPMRGIERKVTVAVFLALSFGVACSITLRDWQYFERSGALVILIAIGVAWKDLVSLVGEAEKLYEGVIQTLTFQLKAPRSNGLILGRMHGGTVDVRADSEERLGDLHAELAELSDLLRYRIRTIEAVVLAIGTLVWGYGAPIASLVWQFKVA